MTYQLAPVGDLDLPLTRKSQVFVATLLLSRGVHPKIVSEMLGHSTVAITLDVYSHVTPAMHREAAHVMDEMLGG